MSCVACPPGAESCVFCNPAIPAMYEEKFKPGYRNHYQLMSVKSGLHPSGNAVYPLQSSVPRCKTCKFFHPHPSVPKSFGFCARAVDEEHKKLAKEHDACAEYSVGSAV